MKRTNTQKGFTIIELVVVILLLGILTATALPRFIDVTDDAHDAVVDGVVGGLATASGLFHAQWIADGEPTTAMTEFNSLLASAGGYPMGLSTTTVDTNQDCIDIFQGLLQGGGQATIAQLAAATNANFSATTSFSTAATDFIARANDPICSYAYTGQFQDLGSPASTPVFTYNTDTGALTIGTEL